MKTIRKINDELAVAGQISLEQLPHIAQVGFRSLLNLRSPIEVGFLPNEQLQAELLNLHYVNLAVESYPPDETTVATVLQQLSILPKPVLIHCDNAMRSAALSLIYLATRQGISIEAALIQATKLGFAAQTVTSIGMSVVRTNAVISF